MSQNISFTTDHEALLYSLDGKADQNSTGITANAKGIAANAKGIAANAKGIAANAKGIAANAKGIAANAKGIATNAKAIAENKKEIGLNRTEIRRLGVLMEDQRMTIDKILDVVTHIDRRLSKQDEHGHRIEKLEYRVSAVESVIKK